MGAPTESVLHTDLAAPAREALTRAMEASSDCARACILCASACLCEEDVAGMRDCILSDLDCADVCETTAKMLRPLPPRRGRGHPRDARSLYRRLLGLRPGLCPARRAP
jgi:hypothetical protein